MAEIDEIGGLRREAIEALIGQLRWEVQANAKEIEGLKKCVYANGRPSLEDRMRTLVEEKISQLRRHMDANMEEGDKGVLNELEHQDELRESQHRDNKTWQREHDERIEEWQEKHDKRMDRLEKLAYLGIGAIGIMKMFLPDNLLHFGGK